MFSLLKSFFYPRVVSPAEIKGLALWLDAQDIATMTVENSTVREWRDKSGYGNHAAHTLKTELPALAAEGIGGKPALSFGENARLYVADTPSLDFARMHLYVVCQVREDAPRSTQVILSKYGEGTPPREWQLLVDASGRAAANASVNGSGSNAAPMLPRAIPLGRPCVLSLRFDGQNLVLGDGTESPASASLSAIVNSSNPITIGGFPRKAKFLGDIGEILFFTRGLTRDEHASIQGYLLRKWNGQA